MQNEKIEENVLADYINLEYLTDDKNRSTANRTQPETTTDKIELNVQERHRKQKIRHLKDQKTIKHNGHLFQLKYFANISFCSICHQYAKSITDMMRYQCEFCEQLVHKKCITLVKNHCECSEAKDTHSVAAIGQAHDLNEKKATSFLTCDHTGVVILPMSKYFACVKCGKNFKSSCINRLPRNCMQSISTNKCEQLNQDDALNYETAFQANLTASLAVAGLNTLNDQSCIGKTSVNNQMPQIEILNDLYDSIAIDPNISKMLKSFNFGESISAIIAARKWKKKIEIEKSDINQFDLIKTLGHGSYGDIYLAKYKIVGERMSVFSTSSMVSTNSGSTTLKAEPKIKVLALKVLPKYKVVEEHNTEAVLIEKDCMFLNCQFLAQAICTFQDPGNLYIAMEYLSGGDLYHYIVERKAKPSPAVIKFLAMETILGIKYLHDKKIIHRDIKAENVVLTDKGHSKIIDFGMAKINVSQDKNPALTFCGTPDYMSPELILNQPYSFPNDIWAWAVLMFELSEGRLPFDGGFCVEDLFDRIKYSKPVFSQFSDRIIPFQMKLLLKECLTKKPKNRININGILDSVYFTEDTMYKNRALNVTTVERKQVESPLLNDKAFLKILDSQDQGPTLSGKNPLHSG